MQANLNIFHQIVNQVKQKGIERTIYIEQSKRLDLTTYKINNISAETVLNSYQKTWKKYQITEELEINPNGWHQNERRVFVWFMMAYTYLNGIKDAGDLLDYVEHDAFWLNMPEVFFWKNTTLLQFQFMNMLRIKKRQSWSGQEDKWLLHALSLEPEGKWNEISKRIYFDSKRQVFRSPKHCRQRWLNHLDISKRKGSWNSEEEKILFRFFLDSGKRWSKIVHLLGNTRTEHTIKNHFNSRISKIINKDNVTEIEAANKILKEIEMLISSPQQNMHSSSSPKVEGLQDIYQSEQSISSSVINQNHVKKEDSIGKELKKQEITSLQIQVSHNDSSDAVDHISQGYYHNYYQNYYPQYYFNLMESQQYYSQIQANYQAPFVQYFTMGFP